MGKKQTQKELEEEFDKAMEEKVEVRVEKVSPFTLEFNNEGLNQLRDKVNEIIEFLNK